MKDVLIIGGGPSGCFMGERLAGAGFDVGIVEEGGEIGQPMCCAGIVGAEGLKGVGIDPGDWALSELTRGVFHPPSGETVELERGRTEAYVIDRAKFDRDLAEAATRAGAELRLKTRCVGISVGESGVELELENRGDHETAEARMVVGADGPSSFTAMALGLMGDFSPTVGVQAEVAADVAPDSAHMFLSNELSEDFFAWTVPSGGSCRVGLGCREGDATGKLKDFISNNPLLPGNSERRIVGLTTGLIPDPGRRKVYGDRVVLVGDAAGHLKPLTGGGLYLGLTAADIAAEVVEAALEDEPTEKALEDYGRRVDEEFGREFELGGRARDVLRGMSDDDFDELLEILAEPEVKDLILENAEFDDHSKLFKALLKEGPGLAASLGAGKAMKLMGWFMDG